MNMESKIRSILTLITGSVILLAGLGLAACKPEEQNVPFETITQGPYFRTGRGYNEKKPDFLVITKPKEVDTPGLEVNLPSELAEQLRTLDYQRSFAIVVFRGLVGALNPKYTIDILQITRAGQKVVLKTLLGEPPPDEGSLSAVSSPYHIIIVSKEGEWAQDIRFVLEVDGQEVKEHSYFVP